MSSLRKMMVGSLVAIAGMGVVASSASASFDRHFGVVASTVDSHPIAGGTGFVFEDQLLALSDRSNVVGSDRGRCRFHGEKARCHVRLHLNGEVGGSGDLLVSGNLGRFDDRLNVTGGTGDFDGVAGKVTLRGGHNNRVLVDLTR